mgnify:CR=1 FL=1
MTKAAELAKMGEVLTNSQIGGRRNIIINGAMQVAQRATSATGLGSNGSTYNTLDRFINVLNGTAGRFTQTQTADGPSGFANCLKIDVTTADTSIASGEYYILAHYLEGQDVQQIKKGTSDAEKVTVSFYVKGNASATYTLELEDADNNRRNSQTFAVTTSWNRVVLTFNADTTGTLDDDNARSFNVNFWLHAGSDFTGGTFSNNSWGTDTNTRVSSSQTSIFDSTDRTFFLTGLQMEVGSQATPFEHRSFGEELALCRRYYYQLGNVQLPASSSPPYGRVGQGQAISGTVGRVPFFFPQAMRAIPTAEVNNIQIGNGATGAINLTDAGIDTNTDSPDGVTIDFTVSSGLTSGQGCQAFQGNNSAGFVAFKAEL